METSDKTKIINLLYSTYNGDIEECSKNENISIAELKQIEVNHNKIDISQANVTQHTKREDIKEKQQELNEKIYDALIIIVDELKLKAKKEKNAKDLAEIGKMISDILKANQTGEGIKSVPLQINSVLNVAVQQQLNPKKYGIEEYSPKRKWDLPESD